MSEQIPLDEVFQLGEVEYLLASSPAALPLFVVRGGAWASSFVSAIVVFLIQTLGTIAAGRLTPNYRVTVSRRDVSRRPYIWRVVLSERFAALDEAESRQHEIAQNWDAYDFAAKASDPKK